MDRVAEYLRKADDAEAKARMISLQSHRQEFLAIAAQWRELARQAADLSATDATLKRDD